MRTGFGVDAHRFKASGVVILAGVVVDDTRGVAATSDGDVVAHALCDALLGAVALGDLGDHFPSSEPQWRGADSLRLLGAVFDLVRGRGFTVSSVDVTVVAEAVRVSAHRAEMRSNLARCLGVDVATVSVKATTTDGLGWLGADEGIAATAVVTVAPIDR
ncbi:MAG: 2-C-methyl-D-erythritol 2,4-cyclodiphosphate synthase [Actinomycetota bacterium]|nr:2-C-methyl-D-erythritol 2,4-cyclodiphosphate synthase [Actinomycetota bacterium]